MTRRHSSLPSTLAPRGLRREEAAAYVGLSPATFDRMVQAGTMPAPKVMQPTSVETWDRVALDRAYAALPDTMGQADGDGVWGEAVA